MRNNLRFFHSKIWIKLTGSGTIKLSFLTKILIKMKSLTNIITVLKNNTLKLVISLAVVSLMTLSLSPVTNAVDYQAQINALQTQNSQTQGDISSLQTQATNYQQVVAQDQAQIASIQNGIYVNTNKEAYYQSQIAQDKAKIQLNKQYLSTAITNLYVQGQMTTIEQLATSSSLSSFVSEQEYNIKIQDNLNSLLSQIKQLQINSENSASQVATLIQTESFQQKQVTADQNQVNQLLAMNQQQQTNYNAQIASNNSQIATLVNEQIAANKKLVSSGKVDYSGTCGGSYPASASGSYGPWGCDYAHSSDYVPGCTYLDSWGMCNRECVSYTAWMVYKNYGINVAGFGNANQWPANAQAAGISIGYTPKVGSVAIYMGGSSDPYGHAMWVKSINSDGTITVDQYNLYYDGNFYETTISPAGLTYIYFGG